MVKSEDERPAQQQQFEEETRGRQARLDRFDFARLHNLKNRPHGDLRPIEKSIYIPRVITAEDPDYHPRLAAESNIREFIHDIRMYRQGKRKKVVDAFLRQHIDNVKETLEKAIQYLEQGDVKVNPLQDALITLLILLDEASQSDDQNALQISMEVISPYLEEFASLIYDRQKNKITPERRRELEAYAVIRELVDLTAFGLEEDIQAFITEYDSYLTNRELFASFPSQNLSIRALALYDLSCFLVNTPLVDDFATVYQQYDTSIQQALRDYIRVKIFAEISKFIKTEVEPFTYNQKDVTPVVQALVPLIQRIQRINQWLLHRALDAQTSYWKDVRFTFSYERNLSLKPEVRRMVLELIPEEIPWWRVRDAHETEIPMADKAMSETPQQRQYYLETRARQERLPQASGVRIHNMKNRPHLQRLRRMEDNIIIENPISEEKLASMSIESSITTLQQIRAFFRYFVNHPPTEASFDRLADYLGRLETALPKASKLTDTYPHLRRAPLLRKQLLSMITYLNAISSNSDQVALQPLESILEPWINKYFTELVLMSKQAEIDKENAFNTEIERLGARLRILIVHKSPEEMLAYLKKHEATLTDPDILSRLKNRNTPARLFVLLDLMSFLIGREKDPEFQEKYEFFQEKVKKSIREYIQQILVALELDISFTLSQPNAMELISQVMIHIEKLGKISAWISERELNIGSKYWKRIVEVLRYPQVKLDIEYRQFILVKLIEASTPLLSEKEKGTLDELTRYEESDFVINHQSSN